MFSAGLEVEVTMIQFDEGTIVALSTPVGTGGVAVIRMTGPQALEIADKVFVSALVRS